MMPPIIHIEETDSTNNYMKSLILSRKPEEETIVVADFQTSGKGQRGNSWESDKGKNLLFSIIFYPDIQANEQFLVSQIISLAIVDVLNKYAKNISIKWPNDIYWKEKKICGVLIENTLLGDKIEESICGIGININQEEFKSDVPNPISLKQITGGNFDLVKLLDEIRESISYYYNKLKSGEYLFITNTYNSLLFRREGYHLYHGDGTIFSAKIENVTPDGRLVLKGQNGNIKSFAFKEVSYIFD